jgi:ubiquinone/menaquinone biosynthesis C-methylase UbiE
MKSRYAILVPIILLALFLVPLVLLRNEFAKRPDAPAADTKAPVAAPTVPTTQPPPAEKPKGDLPPPEPYTFATPSADGIGKIFMGREISKVMGHPGIGWLERTDREKEEAPSKAIALLELAPDTVIADIGAGSGYYTFRLAEILLQGRVVAVDIQQEMLDYLKEEAARRKITNVLPHLGAVDDIRMEAGTLDAVLMVDAYHEFSHPVEMLQSIRKALKPGGKVYLLEYRAEDPNVPIKALHKMSKDQAIKEFVALGFEFVEDKPELPWQHLLIFRKPGQ